MAAATELNYLLLSTFVLWTIVFIISYYCWELISYVMSHNLHMQGCIQKMSLRWQTESFKNVGEAKVCVYSI